jgi:hypothetical protein
MNYEKNCLPIFEPLFKLKAKKKDKTQPNYQIKH